MRVMLKLRGGDEGRVILKSREGGVEGGEPC